MTDKRGAITEHLDGDCLVVTINRPDKRNALRVVDKLTLTETLVRAPQQGAASVVIHGSGETSFCAGSDLLEMSAMSAAEFLLMQDVEADLYDAMMRCPLPIITAVRGWALGTGCVLAAVSDFCIADPDANLGQPEVLNGAPTPIHGALLPRLIGLRRARRLVLTGRPITAHTALEWGLVDEVAPAGGALERACALAFEITAAAHPSSIALQKRIVDGWVRQPFDGAVEASKFMAAAAYSTGWPQTAHKRSRERTQTSDES